MAAPLSVVFDTAQQRLSADSLSTLVSGLDWDVPSIGGAANVDAATELYVEPVMHRVILRPACLHPDWQTSSTAPFDKFELADFSGLTDGSDKWASHQPSASPNGFLIHQGANTDGLSGYLTTALGVNQGIVFEYFNNPGTSGGKAVAAECGWDAVISDGHLVGYNGVSLRFYGGGDVEVWKGDQFQSTHSISSKSDYYDPKQGTIGQKPPAQYTTVFVLPCSDREILVLSSDGGGFSHVFEDLAEGVDGLTILAAGHWGFSFPAPASANVRVALAKFAYESGTIRGAPSCWRETPPVGSPNVRVFGPLTITSGSVGGTATLAVLDSTSTPVARNPYSLDNPVQLEFTLAGGHLYTPVLYGGRVWYDSVKKSTPAEDNDVSDFIREAHIDVCDTVGGTTVIVKTGPPSMLPANVEGQSWRPVVVKAGDLQLLDGLVEDPGFEHSFSFDMVADRLSKVEVKCRDNWARAEEFEFGDPVVLDGMKLYDALAMVADLIGLSIDIDPITVGGGGDFYLPASGVTSHGEWNVVAETGDRGSDWLDRLHQTYLADWAFHIDRFGNLAVKDPSLFSTTPVVTLYDSTEAAIAHGVSASLAPYRVWRSYKRRVLRPEANDVWVVGVDHRTNRPITLHKRDEASINPTTASGSRPANHVGNLLKYSWMDPAVTSMAVGQFALERLFSRLTAARVIVEFECELQESAWKHDLVVLDGNPYPEDGPVRIKTFSGSFEHTSVDAVWRPCRYVTEAGPLVCPLGVPGVSAREIGENWKYKGLSEAGKWAKAVFASRRPVLQAATF